MSSALAEKELALFFLDRLFEYSDYLPLLNLKEAPVIENPPKIRVSPIAKLFRVGVEAEKNRLEKKGWLGIKTHKFIRVEQVELLLGLLGLRHEIVPVPSSLFKDFIREKKIGDILVHEIWFAPVPEEVYVMLVKEKLYITSFDELLYALGKILSEAGEKIVIAHSKFANPGNLAEFLRVLGRTKTRLVMVSETGVIESAIIKEILQTYNAELVVMPTRSHRKQLLVLYKEYSDEQEGYVWNALLLHGSMNVFAPGRDDYLLSVTEKDDARCVLHGIIRALFMV